ncbi:LamG domain-containing protein [Clavibacter michiganensis]|uniref:LamG domain-containing protein n=1 Tax=Clavibacter michiganensis TaxID=28447 RepID=UPI001BDFB4F7|nr:LamG domain-containing protein [Clavibacter michiganensis]MBT1636781.1 LamG domain-containing protein [Clavibacter michiganensis]
MSVVARLLGRASAADARPRRASRLAGIAAAVSAAALGAVLLLAPGTNGAYTAAITNTNNTAASSAAFFTCSSAFAADKANAVFAYALNEASGSTTATDAATGAYPGTYRGSMTSTNVSPQACPRDAGGAYTLNGSTSQLTNSLMAQGPSTFSTELWFKTTVKGGKLIGFGNSASGSSSAYDRHTYVSTTGQLVFGTYNNGYQTLTSPANVADGAWHHVVSTMSPSTGMTLYVDGVRVAGNTAFTAPESNTGYWRIGYDNTSGWPNPGNNYFTGSMRFAALYKTALTATQVKAHYDAGR